MRHPVLTKAVLGRRSKAERSGGFAESDMVVPMEDMGETYQRLANNKRVGKAVKAGAK